ncbi:hypothetical protein ACFQPA_15045 [Halomarina halobia]|uniref:RanBP2-type domain-containing protein n=1 Tax=Halomarina halobia TaxID=3033386 RepID=A0ABD6A905_9EURY|nr:hypothetical protein [Halomarina sp. PSR21]
MTPSTAFVVLSAAALLFAVGWGCRTVLRPAGGADRIEDGAADAAPPSIAWWSRDVSVACPHCDAENDVSTVYCVGCRARLSPEWLTEW